MSMIAGRLKFSLAVLSIGVHAIAASAQRLPSPAQTRTFGAGSSVPAVPNSSAAASTGSPAPCVVTLFSNYIFQSYSAQYFQYAPTCAGPWSKVLFKGSFNVSEGIQFDRTANIQLGYVNIYFGTTEEPSPTSAPAWNVQRDLTDYASLFTTAQSGEVDIYNIVNTTYTGIIYGTATLEFYPVTAGNPEPVTADAVYPLPDGPGAPFQLPNGSTQLAATFQLPTNIERAYLDVVSQGQQGDEFWYLCVPNDVSTQLFSCGNTSFRETEVSIDGLLAGAAPIYPWIFTGGIDPYLWTPLPGVQTLNFTPFRVDLTPFAASLSDGRPHTIALSVFNANNYFQDTASLLVYLDHGSKQITGALSVDTLQPPVPNVVEDLVFGPNGGALGTVTTKSEHAFFIEGFVNTSHGQVETSVIEQINYANVQSFDISATQYTQNVAQNTSTNVQITRAAPQGSTTLTSSFQYPLVVNYAETPNAQGFQILTKVLQKDEHDVRPPIGEASSLAESVETTDTLQLDPTGSFITGNSNQKSSKETTTITGGNCSSVLVVAANNQISGTKAGAGCQ